MAERRNTLTIRVPEDLKQRIERLSVTQGVSINQFALYAFTKEIAELEASEYFTSCPQGVDRRTLMREIDTILETVPDRAVPEWDRDEGR